MIYYLAMCYYLLNQVLKRKQHLKTVKKWILMC